MKEIIKPIFGLLIFWIIFGVAMRVILHSAANSKIDSNVSQQVTREININGQQCTMTILRVDSITTEGFYITCPQTCK